MKLRFWDRFIVGISGLILAVAGVAFLLDFQIGFLVENPIVRGIAFYGTIVAIVLGLYLTTFLFRKTGKKKQLVIQKTDYGELTISVKAIEGMVLKCVQEYDELDLIQMSVQNSKEGMIVKMKVALAAGINIPLAINALQKHIKQYVTSSSGIDVSQVQVEVVSADKKGKPRDSFAVQSTKSRNFIKKEEIEIPVELPVEAEVEEKEKKEHKFHHILFKDKENKDQEEIKENEEAENTQVKEEVLQENKENPEIPEKTEEEA